MLAVGNVGFCRLRVRFFDERLDRNRIGTIDRRANVAKAGFRVRRDDAEGDEQTCRRRFGAKRNRRLKFVHIGDDVIGGHDEQHRIRIVFGRLQRSECHSRRRVAPLRFEDDPAVHLDGCELLGYRKTVCLIADDQAVIRRLAQAPGA